MSTLIDLAPADLDGFWTYRFYDAGGDVLYVGATTRPRARVVEHSQTKSWWPDVAHVEFSRHESEADALTSERAQILADTPTHNTVPRGGLLRLRPNKPKMRHRTFRCSDELWDAVIAKTAEEQTSPSDVLREALERYVKRK